MSGHSKWAGIKHKKAIVDAKRGAAFGKLSRAITVAAREGGGDPVHNATLAQTIEKAKAANMPNDNIDRAIKKGTGEGSDADSFLHLTYEGYGPAGVAIYLTVLTDNKNRTAADVRYLFDRAGGKLGTDGSVSWIFERKGVILVDTDAYDEDELILAAIDAGAEDVLAEGDTYEIRTDPVDFVAVREALREQGIAHRLGRVDHDPQDHRLAWTRATPRRRSVSWTRSTITTTSRRSTPTTTSRTRSWSRWPDDGGPAGAPRSPCGPRRRHEARSPPHPGHRSRHRHHGLRRGRATREPLPRGRLRGDPHPGGPGVAGTPGQHLLPAGRDPASGTGPTPPRWRRSSSTSTSRRPSRSARRAGSCCWPADRPAATSSSTPRSRSSRRSWVTARPRSGRCRRWCASSWVCPTSPDRTTPPTGSPSPCATARRAGSAIA